MAKRSYSAFDLILATDVETTGLAFGAENPVVDEPNNKLYQAISIGMIVADVNTMKPIDELYVEIKFDPNIYTWTPEAEKVHGMSIEYLDKNGLSQADAAAKIKAFIEKYYGPVELIKKLPLLGHNVSSFDRHFIIDTLKSHGIDINFGNRHIDTFTLGVVLLDCFNSNELFDFFELKRDPNNHNALEDARHALVSTRYIRKFFKQAGVV